MRMQRIRLTLLLTVLAATLAAWGGVTWHNRVLAVELTAIGLEKQADILTPQQAEWVEMAEPVVTVGRPYALFGTPVGKISLFFRPFDGDHNHGPISGVDYFFERVQGGWSELESAHCGAQDCAEAGAEAFANLE